MLRRHFVLALVVTVAGSSTLRAQKDVVKKQDDAQKKEIQNVVKVVDDVASAADLPLTRMLSEHLGNPLAFGGCADARVLADETAAIHPFLGAVHAGLGAVDGGLGGGDAPRRRCR